MDNFGGGRKHIKVQCEFSHHHNQSSSKFKSNQNMTILETYPPNLMCGISDLHKNSYEELWRNPGYAKMKSNTKNSIDFINRTNLDSDDMFIEYGCGSGEAGILISDLSGAKVILSDFTDLCLSENAKNVISERKEKIEWKNIDVRNKIKQITKFGYCTQLLEHIPTDQLRGWHFKRKE